MPNPMSSRQAKYGAYAAVYTIVIIAVLVAINFLANRYTKSWDSTANKQFSLADQTKKVVGGLKTDLTINYFDKATQAGVLRRLCSHLRPGGYLFLGHSESLMGVELPVKAVGSSVFQRI